MASFGTVPPEPPVITSLAGLAPLFAPKVATVLSIMSARNQPAKAAETVRTAARQAWLWGFGRQYDDGRGVVTDARTGRASWHFYGLAADIVHATLEWDAPPTFWRNLYDVAHSLGLVSGLDFPSRTLGDRPHIQWGNGMRLAPSAAAVAFWATGGNQAVWKAVGAVR